MEAFALYDARGRLIRQSRDNQVQDSTQTQVTETSNAIVIGHVNVRFALRGMTGNERVRIGKRHIESRVLTWVSDEYTMPNHVFMTFDMQLDDPRTLETLVIQVNNNGGSVHMRKSLVIDDKEVFDGKRFLDFGNFLQTGRMEQRDWLEGGHLHWDGTYEVLLNPDIQDVCATVYGSCNFSGPPQVVTIGRYSLSDMTSLGINGTIGSIRLMGGAKVIMFQHDQLVGKRTPVRADLTCLLHVPVASFIVYV
jgi:hypothetical protein